MKQIYTFLFFLFISIVLNAQNNFKSGYIITNTNDSVVGLIDFRTDGINSQVCRFKANEKAPVKSYYPGDIAKYRFLNEGKYYVSHSITIDNQTQQVFLEYLISGMMNLYYYKKPNYEHEYYFFEDENGNLFPITKKPDEIVDMKLVSDQRYIGALNYLFNDYPSIRKKLNSTVYDRESMIGLAKEFHELTCTSGEGCINFENDYKKSYIFIKYAIYGGMQVHNYTFDRELLRIYESTTSLTPVIGGQLQVSNPRWIKYLSLMADLSFFGIRGEKEYISPGNTSYRKFKFDTFTSSLRINALFSYGLGKFRPVIEGGLCSYVNAIKNSTLYTETNTIPIISETSYNYELPETIFMGVNYGAGFDYLIGNDRFLFCRISFEQVYSGDAIKSTQLKLGITF